MVQTFDPVAYQNSVNAIMAKLREAQGVNATPYTPMEPEVGPSQAQTTLGTAANTALKIGGKKALASLLSSGGAASAGAAYTGGATGLGAVGSASANALAAQAMGPTIANAAALNAGAAGAGSTAGTTAATTAATPIALPVGVALATILGTRSGVRMLQGKQKNWKDASLVDNAGRLALAGGTFGMSEVANYIKNNYFGHKTTRDIARGNTENLLKASDDATYQNYIHGMRDQYDSAPIDPTKPFAGKYANWDEYKKAGLEAGDLTGVNGNLETFGPEYTKLSFDQRKAITQGIIDKGLYASKKSEINITDQDAARQIRDAILAKPVTATRSSTSSPGISKDGKRISYAKKK